ncbi:MAG: HD domain-containing protein [Erysipelotrichaceae bacterium]|nr:HD domain-containing protein [Erysipelotrichaceae bacterium]
MSREELQEFHSHIDELLSDSRVRKMDDFLAHGKISVLTHSVNVAKTAYILNRDLKLGCDLKTLLRGALLHDYYLYDWHDARIFVNVFQMHGFTHPKIARDNAVKDFGVDFETQKVIESHMWPLTFRSFPSSKEAFVVCMADKLCALKEMVERW